MAIFRIIFIDTLSEILYFPLWWYTRGFFKFLKWLGQNILNYESQLGFSIWVRNIFVPMFGQHDWQGRIVSFFMRLVNIIIRGAILLLVIFVHIAFMAIYLLLPVVIIYLIIYYFIPAQ